MCVCVCVCVCVCLCVCVGAYMGKCAVELTPLVQVCCRADSLSTSVL